MSGEVVVKPASSAIPLAIVAIAPLAVVGIGAVAAGACAVGVAKIVKKIVDKRVEASTRELEAEKAKIREWQLFQEEQKQRMLEFSRIQEAIAASEKVLSMIRLSEGRRQHNVGGPTAKGYIVQQPIRADHSAIDKMIQDITRLLEGLPSLFVNSADSPYSRLISHGEKLRQRIDSGNAPLPEEIADFKHTISRTLSSYIEALAKEQEQQAMLTKRTEALLNGILIFMHLTTDSVYTSSLSVMKDSVVAMITKPMKLAGQIDALEKTFAAIKAEIEVGLTNSAFRAALAESMTKNLSEMGYRTVESFPLDTDRAMMKAILKIPGGEQVRIAIQRDNRISFQVCHESGRFEEQLSSDELAVFRAQEGKWCKDLRKLIGRLTAEGFEYVVSLERLIPEVSVPIVVVETTEEILAEAEKENIRKRYKKPKKRYLG